MFVGAALLAITACGGGGDGIDHAWIGNWMEGGTQSTTCGVVSGTTQISGLVVISAGTKGGTLQTFSDNCTLIWDVSGSRATIETGQTCTVSVNGANATVTWTASTMTLNGNTITVLTGGSATNSCSFTQQGTLTKM